MAENDDNKTEVKEQAAPSAKSPLILVLLVINSLVLAYVAYTQYSFMEKESKKPDLATLLKEQGSRSLEAIDEEQPTEDISQDTLVDLESFTVNLAQGDGPKRYVRLNAVLKMDKESEMSEIQSRKPQIRDTIISILNSKRPEDLLKRDGKLYLKEQIKSAINAYLIEGEVTDIFYVGFQIQ